MDQSTIHPVAQPHCAVARKVRRTSRLFLEVTACEERLLWSAAPGTLHSSENVKALAELYELVAPLLLALLHSRRATADQADDALDGAFVQIWRTAPVLQPVSPLCTGVGFPEVLLEVVPWTGADQAFTSVTGGKARLEDLHVMIAELLVAHGYNVGYPGDVRR